MDRLTHKVEVDWIDITSHHGWHEIDCVKDLEVKLMTSVGYLISRRTDDYRIASILTDNACGDVTIIPRGIIQDVRMLKVKDHE